MNIGRVVEIDQMVNPREYQREYQKIFRKRHKHYYRDLKRKMKSQESNYMKKTMKQEVEELKNEMTRLQNVIADLEMKMCLQSTTQKEEITTVASTQACSEEVLLKDML